MFFARWFILSMAIIGGLILFCFYIRERDVFHPLAFVGLAYAIHIGGPMIDITLAGIENHSSKLLGHGYQYLLFPSVVSLISMVLLILGYQTRISFTSDINLVTLEGEWSHYRARLVFILFMLIGGFFIYLFVHTTGGFPRSLSELSVHRTPPTHYISLGANFWLFAFLIGIVNITHGDDSFIFRSVVFLSGIMWFFYPVYASSRSLMMYSIIIVLVLLYYHSTYLSEVRIFAFGIVGLVIVSVLSFVRNYTQRGGEGMELSATEILSPVGLLRNTFGASNGHFTADAHILNSWTDEMSLRFGRSLFEWIVWPVPRALWEDKPVQLGRELAIWIHGRDYTAYPPTLIGDLYINFHLVGVVVGMFVFGMLVGHIHYSFKKQKRTNPTSTLLYAMICTSVLSITSISPTMVGFITDFIPVYIALIIIYDGGIIKTSSKNHKENSKSVTSESGLNS